MARNKFWSFKAAGGGKAELFLYGVIESQSYWWGNGDEITPKNFKADLDALGDVDEISVFINSDGGDVFAGQAIHSMLKRHKAKITVYVDGLAASIASVIAMAGDQVIMPRNAMLMIHNPWTIGIGNAADFRKLADDLDNIRESLIAAYQDKSGMERDQLLALLDAETWLTAEEAVSYGLADSIEEQKEVAAALNAGVLTVNGQEMDLSKFKNAPKILVAASEKPSEPEEKRPTRSLSYFERVLSHNERKYAK